jgi:hypothetical protein
MSVLQWMLLWCLMALSACPLGHAKDSSTSDASNPLNVVNQIAVSAVTGIDDILQQAMDPVQELYVQYSRGENLLPADSYRTLLSYILSRSNIRGIYVGTASGYMHWFETLLGNAYNDSIGCGTDIKWAYYNTTTTQWYASHKRRSDIEHIFVLIHAQGFYLA